jgi:carbon-monoxide dehydrogenase small subunit
LQVAIGPISARFRGNAWVSCDALSHRGEVRGSGGDSIPHLRADGVIHFTARSDIGVGPLWIVAMVYKLAGPLAQFGLPAIVATVEDRLLCEVAEKHMRASQGEES